MVRQPLGRLTDAADNPFPPSGSNNNEEGFTGPRAEALVERKSIPVHVLGAPVKQKVRRAFLADWQAVG